MTDTIHKMALTLAGLACVIGAALPAPAQPMPFQPGSMQFGQPGQPAPAPAAPIKLPAGIVAGKVVTVSHEKVAVNTQAANTAWLDKITIQVDSCETKGTLRTVFYSPGTVSEHTALGALFQQNYAAAIMPNLEKLQQAPNGLGLFWTDANGRILRTGLLGSQMSCTDVPRLLQQFK